MQIDNTKIDELKSQRFKTICFIVFLILVVGLSLFTIKSSIIKEEEQVHEIFNYKYNNSINYKVHLFDNNYFEESYLGMDRQYPTELANIIEIDFSDEINTSSKTKIAYDYIITADINGIYTPDTSRVKAELWNKHFVLVDKTTKKLSSVNKNILKENIKLDFDYYNQIVVNFKSDLRLNIEATLNIEMIINYYIEVDGKNIKETRNLKVDMPLNRTTFEITPKLAENTERIFYSEAKLIIQYPFMIAAIIFLIISLILVVIFVKSVIRINKKTEFQIKLNKILKNYGDVIAESKTSPNYEKYDVMDISEFEDLVDIENEVRIPIIYYEKVKGMEGWFTLIHGEQMYRYILKNNEKPSMFELPRLKSDIELPKRKN